MTENFKKCCEKATTFIESCWDENNDDDGLTFDERISSRLDTLDDDTKEIVINTMNWME